MFISRLPNEDAEDADDDDADADDADADYAADDDYKVKLTIMTTTTTLVIIYYYSAWSFRFVDHPRNRNPTRPESQRCSKVCRRLATTVVA